MCRGQAWCAGFRCRLQVRALGAGQFPCRVAALCDLRLDPTGRCRRGSSMRDRPARLGPICSRRCYRTVRPGPTVRRTRVRRVRVLRPRHRRTVMKGIGSTHANPRSPENQSTAPIRVILGLACDSKPVAPPPRKPTWCGSCKPSDMKRLRQAGVADAVYSRIRLPLNDGPPFE
jgi:hypothetical protein